jgi:low temperature requirement protein LtrA
VEVQVRSWTTAVLRREGEAAHRVTFFELFFDLVYVFAVTQLSHGLFEHLTIQGAAQTLVLLLAVWWAWVYTAWATNWLDPDSRLVRLMLVGVMAAGMLMAAALPEAFADAGLLFALAYATIQVGRTTFVLWAFRHDPVRHRNFQRILAWNVAASLIWIAGGFAADTTRDLIWIAALAVDYAGPAAAFWVPVLGRSNTAEWTVTGSHFAERFKLFVILSLGESVLVTGATFSGLEPAFTTTLAFGLAFVGAVALWWIYFDRSADAGSSVLERTDDPGRLARSAYTYFHLPMVAGIIVIAVADELVIRHPDGHADLATLVVAIGGPVLFFAGHALFKWAIFRVVSVPRLLAIGALLALAPVGQRISPLALAAVVTLIVAAVAVWETVRSPAAGSVSRDEVA